MAKLTPVLGLLGILAGWTSCTTSPETEPLPHASSGGHLWAPMELQRWYYADLDSTRNILEAEIRAAEAKGDHASALANRCLLAEALIFHRHPSARAWMDSLPARSPTGQRALYAAWSQYYHGRWFEADRKWDLADSMLRLVLEPPEERLGPDLFLRARIMQVRLAGQEGNILRADSIAGALRPLVEANGSPRRLAELLQAQGAAHLNGSDPEGAVTIYGAAMDAARSDGDPHVEGQCLVGLAYAWADQGRTEECIAAALKADDAFEACGDARSRVTTLKILGYCYWDNLGPEQVLLRWNKALRMADSLGMAGEAALLRLYLARFRVSLDSAGSAAVGYGLSAKFDSAYALIAEAHQAALDKQDDDLLAQAVNTRAAILNRQGRIDEAMEVVSEALCLFQATGNVQLAITSMIALGGNEIARENYRAAIPWLNKALPLAEQSKFNLLRQLALIRLSAAHEELGHYAKALAYKDQWINLKDSLQGLEVIGKIAQAELRHSFAKRQLADSLMHAQMLALERETAQVSIQRLRLRSLGLAGGGALLVLGGSVAYVLDRKRRRERYARQAAQLETKALRAQMDPHFIFNALNSISAFIRQQQPEKAHHFVARFGQLMRLVLENSRRAEVSLARELEVLQAYLELEQARTGNAFEFSILVDPLADPEEIRVPPLVMQPFVENAVWHGMAGKEGRGQVEISIRLRDGDLVTTISDDGTGMPKDRPAPDGGRSLGTVITRERLDQLAELKGRPAGFRYLERAVGTCVEVVIPV